MVELICVCKEGLGQFVYLFILCVCVCSNRGKCFVNNISVKKRAQTIKCAQMSVFFFHFFTSWAPYDFEKN